MNGGTLNLNANGDITGGDITHTASSTIDLGGFILTYDQTAIDISNGGNAYVLTLQGSGTFTPSSGLTVGDTSTLQVNAATTINGPVELNGGILDVDADTSIMGAVTHTDSSIVNVDPAAILTLAYDLAAIDIGNGGNTYTLTLQEAGQISIASDFELPTDATLLLNGIGSITGTGAIALKGEFWMWTLPATWLSTLPMIQPIQPLKSAITSPWIMTETP